LNHFLARLDSFRSQVPPERMNGLPESLRVIRQHLPARPVAQPAVAPVLA
jgi:hypothetical protein